MNTSEPLRPRPGAWLRAAGLVGGVQRHGGGVRQSLADDSGLRRHPVSPAGAQPAARALRGRRPRPDGGATRVGTPFGGRAWCDSQKAGSAAGQCEGQRGGGLGAGRHPGGDGPALAGVALLWVGGLLRRPGLPADAVADGQFPPHGGGPGAGAVGGGAGPDRAGRAGRGGAAPVVGLGGRGGRETRRQPSGSAPATSSSSRCRAPSTLWRPCGSATGAACPCR